MLLKPCRHHYLRQNPPLNPNQNLSLFAQHRRQPNQNQLLSRLHQPISSE